MNHPASIAPAKPRWLAGVAGTACASTLLAAVVTLFGQASQMDWLAPTAANEAAIAACSSSHGTQARQHCVANVVARVKADAHTLRMAGADAPTIGLAGPR
jgi:hypothetical protein